VSDEPPFQEIDDIENIAEEYVGKLDKIDENIESIVGPDVDAMARLDSYEPEEQREILKNRDEALSIGYSAISIISNVVQKFKSVKSKLIKSFIKLINSFVSLLTKYVGVFNIDSISITISMTPSIVVTLKP